MSVHASASKGYALAADAYVSGRPDYPPETSRWLRDIVGSRDGKTVLEVGAGTGKFLPFLRETGARVLAAEPVEAMRARLAKFHAEVEVLAGTADRLPLPDGSVDAVVCAQAFHWFATADALAEFPARFDTGRRARPDLECPRRKRSLGRRAIGDHR